MNSSLLNILPINSLLLQVTQKLKIAVCQFPVSADICKNSDYIQRFMQTAAANNAVIIHFPETALSGYAGVDFKNFTNFDWITLEAETERICALAKQLKLWVILGTSHRAESRQKPLNSIYVISDKGQIEMRYDKQMLTKNDILYYSKGKHEKKILEINGLKFGFLICYDSCFPEMYDYYRDQEIDVLFNSLYNARKKGRSFLDDITPALLRTRALDNGFWIVATNSCVPYSNWPTCIVAPDGDIRQKLSKHKPGILYHEFPDDSYRKWKIVPPTSSQT